MSGINSNVDSSSYRATPPIDTSHVASNVTTPGPLGGVGEMKTNPIANPNIPQDAVGSTQYVSRNATDSVDTGTKAFENSEKGRDKAAESLSPDTQRALTSSVLKHDNPVSLKESPGSNQT